MVILGSNRNPGLLSATDERPHGSWVGGAIFALVVAIPSRAVRTGANGCGGALSLSATAPLCSRCHHHSIHRRFGLGPGLRIVAEVTHL